MSHSLNGTPQALRPAGLDCYRVIADAARSAWAEYSVAQCPLEVVARSTWSGSRSSAGNPRLRSVSFFTGVPRFGVHAKRRLAAALEIRIPMAAFAEDGEPRARWRRGVSRAVPVGTRLDVAERAPGLELVLAG